MKHTTLKLISVILAVSTCLILGGCTAKSSKQAANATTAAPTTQSDKIEFTQIYSSYLFLSVIPDIKNIKYKDSNKYSGNLIIINYDDYVKAVNTINKTAIEAKLESKNKSFFDTKSVVFHFDIDGGHLEYLNHQFKSISVDDNTMTIEAYREMNKNFVDAMTTVHVVAAEVDKSDIQSVENIVVNHHDSYN